jgi:hypothetical protein
VRPGEVDNATDAAHCDRDDRDDRPQVARPPARLAVVALAQDVIIHRRTPGID